MAATRRRTSPFVGSAQVPWLRPLAQVLRLLALAVGTATALERGWSVVDAGVAVGLVGFLLWRTAPPVGSPLRLRDVMALEVVLATLAVALTGGWSSPWLAAQFVPVGLAALGLPMGPAVLLGVVTVLLDTAASLPAQPAGLEVVARAATLLLVVGFAIITRGVLTSTRGHDEALGRLDVLWSVRALLQGLHSETVDNPVTFRLDEAVMTLRSSSPTLGAVEVLGLFALDPDGMLRLVHGVGLPDTAYRVRDLPGRAGEPARDGEVLTMQLPAGGVVASSRWGAYVWLRVSESERAHVLVVEHPEDRPGIDDVRPELARIAEPLAVTVHNAAWFTRVSHLGVDEERQRIAARLHDRFAQQLAVVSMELELAARRHPDDEALRALRVEVRDSLTSLRDTMVELRATVDDEHPLEHVLVGLVDRLRTRHGLVADLEVEVAGPPLPSSIGQQLLRIVQELTRRAVEDRGAIAVYVRYRCSAERVEVVVSDDGTPPVSDTRHRDLSQVVLDRVESIGASIETDRSADDLATVTIVVDRAAQGART